MSVKKIHTSITIVSTVILVIIGMCIVISALLFTPLPVRSSELSQSFTDGFTGDLLNNSSISSYYINLDPVKDIRAGDLIEISGETNWKPGSIIVLKITPVFVGRTDMYNSKITCKSFLGLMGSTTIPSDNNIVHHWSWIANSSELSPNLYEITASIISPNTNTDPIQGLDITVTSRFSLTQ